MGEYGSIGIDEIIGEMQEIIGEIDFDDDDDLDLDEEVGARNLARSRRLKALSRRMSRLRNIDPNAVMVKTNVDRARRRLMLPTDPLTLAAATSDTLEIKPQRLFRTELIIIPSDIASNFEITDIKIGQASQYVGAGSIPGLAFSEAAVNAFLHLDSANVGNTILFDITNLDAANPHTFRALLLGTATIR